jgi:hypothetical protein
MNNKWISCSTQLPREHKVVETKIDDKDGLRNFDRLVFSNNLWWLEDKSMYYSPTHWREIL